MLHNPQPTPFSDHDEIARPLEVAVGAFLAGTAVLKLVGGVINPLPAILPMPVVEFATPCEGVIGILLVFGVLRSLAWAAAVFLFSAFAAVSGVLLATGAVYCGCFGPVAVPPWASLAIDLACLTVLVASRWTFGRALAAGAAGAGTVGLLALVASWGGSNLSTGGGVTITPRVLDIGTGLPGDIRSASVEVINGTAEDITILGALAACTCTTTDDLPLAVPAGGRAKLSMKVSFQGSPRRFEYMVVYNTDRWSGSQLVGTVRGEVLAAEPAGEAVR